MPHATQPTQSPVATLPDLILPKKNNQTVPSAALGFTFASDVVHPSTINPPVKPVDGIPAAKISFANAPPTKDVFGFNQTSWRFPAVAKDPAAQLEKEAPKAKSSGAFDGGQTSVAAVALVSRGDARQFLGLESEVKTPTGSGLFGVTGRSVQVQTQASKSANLCVEEEVEKTNIGGVKGEGRSVNSEVAQEADAVLEAECNITVPGAAPVARTQEDQASSSEEIVEIEVLDGNHVQVANTSEQESGAIVVFGASQPQEAAFVQLKETEVKAPLVVGTGFSIWWRVNSWEKKSDMSIKFDMQKRGIVVAVIVLAIFWVLVGVMLGIKLVKAGLLEMQL